MSITVDGREHVLGEKDALLVFPNQVHAFHSHTSRDVLFIFSSKLIAAFASKYAKMLPESNQFHLSDDLVERLCALEEHSSSIEMKGVLYLVCAEFEKGATYRAGNGERENLLLKIFDFVENHYKGDCTLQALSRGVGYDAAYLSRYFKKATGLPYNSYVNGYRLNQAGYLLRNGQGSVLDCSLECGYTSLRTFNRNFKDYYGQTPLEYKRECEK
jgi:AraC-like DNA-binding protein